MEGDRERWNAKWRERAAHLEMQAELLNRHATHLPTRGKALDIAGGAGRNAIWLARRGLDVTLVDVSDVALEKAESRARNAGLAGRMRFLRLDLDKPLELAPLFDVVLIFHYLNRAQRDDYAQLLLDDGILIAAQPTVTNLERHAKPGREYLVEPGELRQWIDSLGFELLVDEEGWTDENRHEAAVVAKRRTRVAVESAPQADSGPKHGPYR